MRLPAICIPNNCSKRITTWEQMRMTRMMTTIHSEITTAARTVRNRPSPRAQAIFMLLIIGAPVLPILIAEVHADLYVYSITCCTRSLPQYLLCSAVAENNQRHRASSSHFRSRCYSALQPHREWRCVSFAPQRHRPGQVEPTAGYCQKRSHHEGTVSDATP